MTHTTPINQVPVAPAANPYETTAPAPPMAAPFAPQPQPAVPQAAPRRPGLVERFQAWRIRRMNDKRNVLEITLRSGSKLQFDHVLNWKSKSQENVVQELEITQHVACRRRFGFVDLREIVSVQERVNA